MFRFKLVVTIILFALVAYNLFTVFRPSEINSIRRQMNSLSHGDQYVGRLNYWYYLVQNQQWDQAKTIENTLDPADISYFYSLYHPTSLKKTVNQLVVKENKTSDDYVELARIQFVLGMQAEALKSLESAKQLDPIRQDIDEAIYRFSLLSEPLL